MKARFLAGSALAVLLGLTTASAADQTDLIGEILKSDQHTIFAVALKETGLIELLRGKGPFTVFAPTDAAFDKLGDDKIRAIVKDKELLKKILLAHIVNRRLLGPKDLTELNGQTLNGFKVVATKDGITVGGAKVVFMASPDEKGILYGTDAVLLPAE